MAMAAISLIPTIRDGHQLHSTGLLKMNLITAFLLKMVIPDLQQLYSPLHKNAR
jgi:hypothetical protein